MKPLIIIPAFSRATSLARLLSSIENAKYPAKDINLVISLDGGAAEAVINVAESFMFSHGKVEIVKRNKNIGLREHILWCGEQSTIHGSVIVLEDDLIVDPFFYFYATAALTFYENCDLVAGIALYSQKFNEYANLPFFPLYEGRTNYFMQVGCSWGQAWTARQWLGFKEWCSQHSLKDIEGNIRIPAYVKAWRDSSWKKYLSAYLASSEKHFVYPHLSYTSNCADAGGFHSSDGFDYLQVPMASGERQCEMFNFVKFDESNAKYDPFMEPLDPPGLEKFGICKEEIAIDFYGTKPISLVRQKSFCITSRKATSVEKNIPLRFKPIEMNLLHSSDEGFSSTIKLIRSETIAVESALQKITRHFELARYYSNFEIRSKRFIAGSIMAWIKERLAFKKSVARR